LKRIHNLSDELVVINFMTVPPQQEMLVIDEDVLESDDVKALLKAGKIVVIDESASREEQP
jgi:hypothetical protein